MVVRFNKRERKIGEIIETPQPLVLSFCGEYTDCGGIKNIVLGDG